MFFDQFPALRATSLFVCFVVVDGVLLAAAAILLYGNFKYCRRKTTTRKRTKFEEKRTASKIGWPESTVEIKTTTKRPIDSFIHKSTKTTTTIRPDTCVLAGSSSSSINSNTYLNSSYRVISPIYIILIGNHTPRDKVLL